MTELNEILLEIGNEYDDSIVECLMYENFSGDIVDGGKVADKSIYKTLKWMEKEYKIKL